MIGRTGSRGRMVLILLALGILRTTILGADESRILVPALHLQRFLALANSQTDDPPIRVLVYGQSITAQAWSGRLLESLRTGFPDRRWRMENRAIGGTTAEYLVRTAEADLFPYQPDLVIFHAYGDTNAYAGLIRNVRARTCADILLVGNHYAAWDSLAEAGIGEWDGVTLPALAAATGACHADIRTPWKQHLIDHALPIGAMLLDTVHLNPDGDRLMEELVGQYLRAPALQPPVDPYRVGRTRRLQVDWGANPRVEVPFRGTRVVARLDRGIAGRTGVGIDGTRPSAVPGGAVHGRTSPWPRTGWPAILAVGSAVVPVPETWTLTVEQVNGPDRVAFRLDGSVTGFDGRGRSWEQFRSLSERVTIAPTDWYWLQLRSTLEAGFRITWNTRSTGVDEVRSDGTVPGVEWVDLVGGLEPADHRLVLELEEGSGSISELIIYDPSAPEDAADGDRLHWVRGGTGMLVTRAHGGTLEMSPDLEGWLPVGTSPPSGRGFHWLPYAGGTAFMGAGPATAPDP